MWVEDLFVLFQRIKNMMKNVSFSSVINDVLSCFVLSRKGILL